MTSIRPHNLLRLALLGLVVGWLAGCSALASRPAGPSEPGSVEAVQLLPTQTLTPGPTSTPTVTPLDLAPTLPPLPPATPTPPYAWLTGQVRVFPGPRHYVGDLITVEVAGQNLDQVPSGGLPTLAVGEAVLPGETFVAHSPLRENSLVFRWVWDTNGWEPDLYALTARLPTQISGAPGPQQRIDFLVKLEPADRRPPQEEIATWVQRRTRFAAINYLTGTAAERDIQQIAAEVDDAFTHVADELRVIIPGQPVPVTIIDNVWGNGAYTGDDLVLSYVDRSYTSLDTTSALRHEVVHWAMREVATRQTPLILSEGLAVTVAAGHFKPEPIPERAAALLALDIYIPLTDLANNFWAYQHEVAYLESAGLVTYLIERYGLDAFIELYGTGEVNANSPAGWLDVALHQTYGVSLIEVEQGYITWLEQHDPGAQVTDLRLSIALYDTIRRYQALYAPYQESLPSVEAAEETGQVSEYMREPTDSFNTGVEAALVAAQRALVERRYGEVDNLLIALNTSFNDGDFNREPLASYMAIARRIAAAGGEVQRIDLAGDQATVTITHIPPQLMTVSMAFDGEEWQIVE